MNRRAIIMKSTILIMLSVFLSSFNTLAATRFDIKKYRVGFLQPTSHQTSNGDNKKPVLRFDRFNKKKKDMVYSDQIRFDRFSLEQMLGKVLQEGMLNEKKYTVYGGDAASDAERAKKIDESKQDKSEEEKKDYKIELTLERAYKYKDLYAPNEKDAIFLQFRFTGPATIRRVVFPNRVNMNKEQHVTIILLPNRDNQRNNDFARWYPNMKPALYSKRDPYKLNPYKSKGANEISYLFSLHVLGKYVKAQYNAESKESQKNKLLWGTPSFAMEFTYFTEIVSQGLKDNNVSKMKLSKVTYIIDTKTVKTQNNGKKKIFIQTTRIGKIFPHPNKYSTGYIYDKQNRFDLVNQDIEGNEQDDRTGYYQLEFTPRSNPIIKALYK